MSSKDSAAGKGKRRSRFSAGSSDSKRHKHGSDKNSATSSTPVNFFYILLVV